jgi:hypothetical protein
MVSVVRENAKMTAENAVRVLRRNRHDSLLRLTHSPASLIFRQSEATSRRVHFLPFVFCESTMALLSPHTLF